MCECGLGAKKCSIRCESGLRAGGVAVGVIMD
jgi:hypothetical protein